MHLTKDTNRKTEVRPQCVFCDNLTNGTFLAEVLPAAVVTGCGVQTDSKQGRGRIEGDLL